MLHCVHKPVANLVCLPFSDGQVVYSGFIRSDPKQAGWKIKTMI